MMKNIIFLLLGIFSLIACTEENPGLYTGNDYIQFYYNGTASSEIKANPVKYPSISAKKTRDTAYFRLQVAGHTSKYPRVIRFEQYVDSTSLTYSELAQPGVNYVSFDDPEIQKLMVIPADSIYMNIPVIVTYDMTVKGSFVLDFKLVETEDFEVGNQRELSKGKLSISNY